MLQVNRILKISEKESDLIWEIKAVAIIFTICAHCNTVLENNSLPAKTVSCLLGSFGSLGVPIFLFFSGYLFSYKPLIKCIQTKIKSMVIPWLFCGTLVYLYVYLRKGSLSISTYSKWLIGIDTYLWYLSISILLIVLGECICFISNRTGINIRYIEVILILISLGMIFLEKIDVVNFHPYLNIFRWQWLFLLGMISRETRLVYWIPSNIIPFIFGTIVLLVLAFLGRTISYWSLCWEGAAVLAVMSVIMLCKCIKRSYSFVLDIGKKSFSIYLLHMPVAGITANILNRFYDLTGLATLLRPVVVLMITYFFIRLADRLVKSRKTKSAVQGLLGIR